MLRFITLAKPIALVAALTTAAHAQRAAASADSAITRIDRVFSRFSGVAMPGCAVGVSQNGAVVLTRGYGGANLEYAVPITDSTIFESGSVAKQFTAAAIVLLAQDGKLRLDEDIRRFVPEVPNFGTTITIRHLLNHTSGLRDQWGLLGIEGRGPGTQVHSPATTLDLVAHQASLNFPPGSEYLYSNTGYALLGIIVARASGMSLQEFTRTRLFEPLGMTHTRWRDDFTAIVPGRATAYSGNAAAGYRTNMPFTNMIGNGGLLTTVGDLLTWNENLSHPRVGGQAMVDSLETRGRLTSGRTISYALGLTVGTYGGVKEVSHSGSTAGYSTFLTRFPDQSLSVAVLCNHATNPTPLAHAVADIFLPPRAAAQQAGVVESVTLSGAALERWTGYYADPKTAQPLRLAARDGKIVNLAQANAVIIALSPDRLRAANGLELERITTGRGKSIRLIRPDADTSIFISVDPPTVNRATDYVGTYVSDELDVQLVLAVEQGQLRVKRRPADVLAATPVYRDAYDVDDLGTLRFTRDASGKVNGFGIFAGRVRDVRFRRNRS